jgi:hypothetical protein
MMRALTLWQSWAWAVAAGGKAVENRPWPPPRNMLGVPFALHAGKRWDPDGEDFIRKLTGIPAGDPLVESRGAVIGIATVERIVRADALPGTDQHPETLTVDQRPWFFGPYGWVLRDVTHLARPVPCRGFQMLWTLPDDVEREVRRQLLEATP